MAPVSIEAEKQIIQAGSPMTNLPVIVDGSIRAIFPGGEILLGRGDIIGIPDIGSGIHSCSYIAATDSSVVYYPYENKAQTFQLISSSIDLCHLYFNAVLRFLCTLLHYESKLSALARRTYGFWSQSLTEYQSLCQHYDLPPRAFPSELLPEVFPEREDVEDWMGGYYESLRDLDKDVKISLYKRPLLYRGLLLGSCGQIARVLDICNNLNGYMTSLTSVMIGEQHLDLLDLYTDLMTRCARNSLANLKPIEGKIQKLFLQEKTFHGFLPPQLTLRRREEYQSLLDQIARRKEGDGDQPNIQILEDALDTILQLAGCDLEQEGRFRTNLAAYKALPDKDSSDDNSRKVRRTLADDFFKIYTALALKCLKAGLAQEDFPPAVWLFLNFGFVDTKLAGEENATFLLSLKREFQRAPNYGIYTFYEWLKAIYEGKKEPSRNEFDTDYMEYLREQQISGKITAAEKNDLMQSKEHRILFECQNLFPLADRVTFGRISTFCPVFSQHNVLRELGDTLMTPEILTQALAELRSVDFGAFYRPVIYSNEAAGLTHEYVQTEILPDIILMPNVGSRGSMWQEIEGRRRNTPARLLLPIFLTEHLPQILTRMAAEYRWEMCKRIQGVRWNDVSEPSLTSAFCDYAQFYKKNRDLSPDAKEKLHAQLQRAKNNFKELFIQDYQIWIGYEGKGAPRLNRVSREILFTYCPFSAKIREAIGNNPLYKNLLDRFQAKRSQEQKRFAMVISRIEQCEDTLPISIQEHKKFLEL